MCDERTPYVCPAERAGWLVTPLRRLIGDPKRILRGLAGPGDTVLDLGCGPGYFTLPLARMVGEGGEVVAVDLQADMLVQLAERARRAGLEARIRQHQCAADALGLGGVLGDVKADAALAFWMVHEVPDPGRFLAEVAAAVKPAGRLLLVEPRGEVSAEAFAQTEELAAAVGFLPVSVPRVWFSRAVLLERGAPG